MNESLNIIHTNDTIPLKKLNVLFYIFIVYKYFWLYFEIFVDCL
jgi:hypothetical protein